MDDEEEHERGGERFCVGAEGHEQRGHTGRTTARVGVKRVVASHREEQLGRRGGGWRVAGRERGARRRV